MASLKTIVEVKEGPELPESEEPHCPQSSDSSHSPIKTPSDEVSVETSLPAEPTEESESSQEKSTDESIAFTKPIEDPLDKALRYLSKHNILQLFQGLSAGIAYSRPQDPLDHLITEIKKIRDMDRLRKGVIKKSELNKH